MSQPVTTSERRSLSLNGNKKKNVPVDVEAVNGKSKKEKEAHKNGQKAEKIANSHDNDVIVIDEDDLPLKKIAEFVDAPIVEELVTVVQKKQEAEEKAQKSRESTPKKRGKTDKSPRGTPVVPVAPVAPAVENSPKPLKKTDSDMFKEAEAALEAVFDEDWTEDVPKKETKVLKLQTDLLTPKRRSDRLQNASTIVNLSTMSEQSTAMETDTSAAAYDPGRKVSGRRSTRPMDEIRFTYRSKVVDDSVNVTVGSELNATLNSTLNTDRKRALSTENIESPKRARLDLSGIFSAVVTPMTMLRDRLRRAHLQSSTPNKMPELNESEVQELEITVEDVGKTLEGNDEPEKNEETETLEEDGNDKEDGGEKVDEIEEKTPTSKRRCNIM